MESFLFDSHAHLDLSPNLGGVIKRIEKNRIYTIAVTNLPPLYTKFKSIVDSKYIQPALGFHPELIGNYQKYIPQMWSLIEEAKYIGEVGLDYKAAVNSKSIQLTFFELLIQRCDYLGGKILTIHSRNSVDDVLSVIGSRFNSKFILHWYSGNLKNVNLAIQQGAYFSINIAMTLSQSGLKVIDKIPNDRLLLESDYPFILKKDKTPFEIMDLSETVKKLAKIKNLEYEEMILILNQNFREILK